ncbi:hypothetical protein P5G62_008140 [Neobacillus sp. 179-C4.2 HS]|uniref:DUF723 domain-containing protein n=1 Tax=Neobacillus driksii TaxID=3035913 RepID=A0ABV4YS14_9BACI|nr:hypothetical protein [Neobacillus sp. 179.-C4.2 HS]MDP5196948.1 hypothetical protein [Neobacillus sp. 179.-C4.2 HS]
MRKFTYEEVKQVFEERGYELLDQEYISTRVKMRFRCPIHPNDEQCTTFDNFLRGKTGCVCCSGKKHSIDEVRKEFERRGYQLLETRYINSITKMRYRCPKHPDKINKIEFYALLNGNRCPHCYNETKSKWYSEGGNPNWNGGITSLSMATRECTKNWKSRTLIKYEFKCAVTGERANDLQIHHTKSFATLRDEVLKELNFYKRKNKNEYTHDELQLIFRRLEQKHDEIVGIPLRKQVHILFHKIYGRKNNTLEQFLEFKRSWEKGEFNEQLELELFKPLS